MPIKRDRLPDSGERVGRSKPGAVSDPLQQQLLERVKRLGNIYGYTLTDAEASKIRDSVYSPGDRYTLDNFNTLVDAMLGQYKPGITDDHSAKARGLLDRELGAGGYAPEYVDYFAQELANGASLMDILYSIRQSDEYMKKRSDEENARVTAESASAREALNQELLKGQQEAFNRALPNIISSYMKSGRLGSSGLNAALANAQADLERERQSFLGNAGYQDAIRAQGYNRENFVNNNAAAFNQALRQLEPRYQAQMYRSQLPFNAVQNSINRSQELQDYNLQREDYMSALRRQERQGNRAGWMQLGGGILGAGLQGWAYNRGMRRGY